MDYEETFIRSWDALEVRCAAGIARYFPPELAESIQELVREMRRRGYDRLFRAGMAAYDIVLSRSAEHGLRNDQPSVTLSVNRHLFTEADDRRMEVYWGSGDQGRFTEESYQLTPRLEAALANWPAPQLTKRPAPLRCWLTYVAADESGY